MTKRTSSKKRNGKLWVLVLVFVATCAIVFIGWFFRGIFFISNEKPNKQQQLILDRDFPGITIKAMNDTTMTCYQFNSIDLSADSTYNTFIASFKNIETYKVFQSTGNCPPEVRE